MYCNVNSPVAPNDETYVVTKHPNINNIYTFKNVCIKNYLKGKKRSLAYLYEFTTIRNEFILRRKCLVNTSHDEK